MIDEAILAYIVDNDALADVQRAGATADDFIDEYRTMFRFIERTKRQHGNAPSRDVLLARFPDAELPRRVRDTDVPVLMSQLRQRRKHKDLVDLLIRSGNGITDYESVDDVMSNLQGELSRMNGRYNGSAHLVDLFDPRTTRKVLRTLRANRAQNIEGERILTGLESFDALATGGLRPQQMVVIMGRTGIGKSWLNLLFVTQAVLQGKTVILYPLEMTLYDTAMRLYTIFTQEMFGQRRVLKNLDLLAGNVNTRRVAKLLAALEDKFKGCLHVADMGSLSDPYTVDRIDAEVELHKPDMFWVDYITLLRATGLRNGSDDWAAVRQLSNGIKGVSMRHQSVGGASAQVNREAMRIKAKDSKVLLPRLEHISYGDSIGQDADLVFSINRNDAGLWYALVKNRSGPEIGRRLVRWMPNTGSFREIEYSEDDVKA